MIPRIIEQYAEEAAIVWLRRDYAATQPHIVRDDLAEIDRRLDAIADGLVLAERGGWDACWDELQRGDDVELYAPVRWMVTRHDLARWESLRPIARHTPIVERTIAAAVAATTWDDAEPWVAQWCSGDCLERCLAAAVARMYQQPEAVPWRDWLDDDAPQVRRAAIAAIGTLGLDAYRQTLMTRLMDDRETELESAVSLARWEVDEPVREVVSRRLRDDEREKRNWTGEEDQWLAEWYLSAIPHDDACCVVRRWREEAVVPLFLLGCRVVADAQFLEDVIPWLDHPEWARPAGEVVTHITGLRFSAPPLEGEPPADWEGGPNDDPDDDDVALDPYDNLPWPNRAAVTDAVSQPQLPVGQPLILGRSCDAETLHDVWARGQQRERRHASIRLALRQPNRPYAMVTDPTARQCEFDRGGGGIESTPGPATA